MQKKEEEDQFLSHKVAMDMVLATSFV